MSRRCRRRFSESRTPQEPRGARHIETVGGRESERVNEFMKERRVSTRDARARRRRVAAFASASALALACANVRAAEGWTRSSDGGGRGRRLVDVTGSAFFDVFGFELSAGAVFDPVCEFLNPFLAPEYRLSACERDIAAEDAEEYAYEDPVAGVDEVEGTFVNGVTGNVAGGIGGGAVGGVAGGSAGFVGGGLGAGGIGGGAGALGRR